MESTCINYIVENNNYPIINILSNINIFELVYSLGTNILKDFKKNFINDDTMILACNFNNIPILSSFYINLMITKKLEDNKIIYVITNNDNEFDSIQFNYFNIYVTQQEQNKYKIILDYDINKEMYSKPIISFVNKILNKLFSNLETYLCKITT